jgi:undecaprenyl-diphosphatase
VLLGLVQGPAELLPISSSAHTALIPWLAGWRDPGLRPGERKPFEVALHAGGGCALAVIARRPLARALVRMTPGRAGLLTLSILPAALAGTALRGPIERRLGGPRAIAAGLLCGSLAMALAELRGEEGRACEQAGAGDALVLGLAQALALAPGVSRSGATLAAARARGFSRDAALRLSWSVALPVILGASAFEALRAVRVRTPVLAPVVLAGGLAAFLSTLASAALLGRARLTRGALLGCALYRCLLAAFVALRLRRAQ